MSSPKGAFGPLGRAADLHHGCHRRQRAPRHHPGPLQRFGGVVTPVVAEGDHVEAGATVATIEAMKMEASITAPVAGTVERIALGGTQQVEGGDLVLVIS